MKVKKPKGHECQNFKNIDIQYKIINKWEFNMYVVRKRFFQKNSVSVSLHIIFEITFC